VYWIHLVALD